MRALGFHLGRGGTALVVLALMLAGALAVLAHLGTPGGAAGAAGGGARATATAGCLTPGLPVTMEPSYAVGAANLHELKAMSDVIAQVSVVGAASQESVMGTAPSPAEVSTVYAVRVVRVLKGPRTLTSGGGLSVIQAGGFYHCSTWQIEGDPLMRAGEQDVLFLTQDVDGSGRSVIVDDTLGRFMVTADGMVGPVSDRAWHLPMRALGAATDAGAVPLDEFIREVQSA